MMRRVVSGFINFKTKSINRSIKEPAVFQLIFSFSLTFIKFATMLFKVGTLVTTIVFWICFLAIKEDLQQPVSVEATVSDFADSITQVKSSKTMFSELRF